MIVASSSPSPHRIAASGGVRGDDARPSVGQSVAGESGSAMHGRPPGTPAFIVSQSSSLPTNSSRASLCSRIWRTVSAASVG